MTFEQILSDLKNKIYKPIYLLSGDEPYYIDQLSDYIEENVLTEAEAGFNLSIVYGKDTEARAIDNLSKRYPMMANYQIVIVKEAQDLKDIDALQYYAEKPLNSTILVLNFKYKTLDKRKKVYKAIEKNGVIFNSKKLYDNQVPDWIGKYLVAKKLSIVPSASALLAEYLGTDLSKIANELNKLAIILPEGTKITSEHIEKNIGISKDYNNFELQKAVADKDIVKANRIINYFAENQKEHNIITTITVLFNFFTKLLMLYFIQDKSKQNIASVLKVNPFFAQEYINAQKKYSGGKLVRIISILREYDLKSKGVDNVSADAGDLMREMIYKIMH